MIINGELVNANLTVYFSIEQIAVVGPETVE